MEKSVQERNEAEGGLGRAEGDGGGGRWSGVPLSNTCRKT